MKISYAITVCDEFEELKKLIYIIQQNIRTEDEICVLVDKPKASKSLLDFLGDLSLNGILFFKEATFTGNFSEWKNILTEICTGDYIFQIDADELPSEFLLKVLPEILIKNSIDVILVPRINIVNGITQEHIIKWNWNIEADGRINWPDYQWRIYKNIPEVRWINKVHERLDGFSTYSKLPKENEYSLIHIKDIKKQEKQNNFYDSL